MDAGRWHSQGEYRLRQIFFEFDPRPSLVWNVFLSCPACDGGWSGEIQRTATILFGPAADQGVNLKLGILVERERTCDKCGYTEYFLLEKGVDVQLAVDMIKKAEEDSYDVAYLVSADSDFVPAVEMVRYHYKKQVFCAAPKGARYGRLANACNTAIPITQEFVNKSQVT